MKTLLLILLFAVNSYAQDGTLTVIFDGSTETFKLTDCYKRSKVSKNFSVVVWGAAVYWDKSKQIVVRSFNEKHSTNKKIYNLRDNVIIDFDNPTNIKVPTITRPVKL